MWLQRKTLWGQTLNAWGVMALAQSPAPNERIINEAIPAASYCQLNRDKLVFNSSLARPKDTLSDFGFFRNLRKLMGKVTIPVGAWNFELDFATGRLNALELGVGKYLKLSYNLTKSTVGFGVGLPLPRDQFWMSNRYGGYNPFSLFVKFEPRPDTLELGIGMNTVVGHASSPLPQKRSGKLVFHN